MMAATAASPTTAWSTLLDDIAACSACPRMAQARVLSPLNGPLDARAIFVAEAPGRLGAALTGVPLTGDESGRRFERFLALAGLSRSDVFVTNAVLCNPLDAHGRNRTPSPGEIARCRPYLERTLDAVRAPVVVALGRVALESLRAIDPHKADLGEGVGATVVWRSQLLVPLYHPSRQSTLHRSQDQQDDDWRRLGAIVRGCS
jgi:uracil-DNA glycosylase family 4